MPYDNHTWNAVSCSAKNGLCSNDVLSSMTRGSCDRQWSSARSHACLQASHINTKQILNALSYICALPMHFYSSNCIEQKQNQIFPKWTRSHLSLLYIIMHTVKLWLKFRPKMPRVIISCTASANYNHFLKPIAADLTIKE